MAKKNINQLLALGVIEYEPKGYFYVVKKNFLVTDDEGDQIEYFSTEANEGWAIDYTRGRHSNRIKETKAMFIVYKMVP